MNRNLIGYRKIVGLTQKEIAKQIGIGETSYCHKERGQTDFTQTEMEKIVDLFQSLGYELMMNYLFFRGESLDKQQKI